MKINKRIFFVTVLISIIFSFNTFAMNYNKDYVPESPKTENKYEDRSLDYRWTWINDLTCVQFNVMENTSKEKIIKFWELGMLPRWVKNESSKIKAVNRETYSGKWSQATDGTRSFTFDDGTIPVGVTKIDSVLYAFNTFGELKAGYEYYTGYKTEADGLVKADSAEYTQWLATQYLPECTSYDN
jgi:hypothetical protein